MNHKSGNSLAECLWFKVSHKIAVIWRLTGAEGSAHPHNCWQALLPHPMGHSTGLPHNMAGGFPQDENSERELKRVPTRESYSLCITQPQKWHPIISPIFYSLEGGQVSESSPYQREVGDYSRVPVSEGKDQWGPVQRLPTIPHSFPKPQDSKSLGFEPCRDQCLGFCQSIFWLWCCKWSIALGGGDGRGSSSSSKCS